MPDFARIIEARSPHKQLNLMRAPMEAGLIPDCGEYYERAFDRHYGYLSADDDTDARPGFETPLGNSDAVEAELFHRYMYALDQVFERSGGGSIAIEDAEAVLQAQADHRKFFAKLIAEKFPAIQVRHAVEKLWGNHRTDTRKERIGRIHALLEAGHEPRRGAADLLKQGYEGLADPLAGLLPLAKEVFGEAAADKTKNCVRRPWPRGFFDADVRMYLYYRASSRAYRRAYDDFFVWSRVEYPPLLTLRIDCIDTRKRSAGEESDPVARQERCKSFCSAGA